jgi:diacylglycerol kinase family enzyme
LARTITAGRVTGLDLGILDNRRFALMAGFGFDADVVTRHHRARVCPEGLPRPSHRAAYVEPVLSSSLAYRFPAMAVRVTDSGHDETLWGSTIFVFNLPRYALGLPFAPGARGDDGWLDLVVFRDPGPFRALHYLWLVIRGLHLKRPGVEHRRVRRAVITATGTVPVQLDGDPFGTLPASDLEGWAVEVLPAALSVLVPPSDR